MAFCVFLLIFLQTFCLSSSRFTIFNRNEQEGLLRQETELHIYSILAEYPALGYSLNQTIHFTLNLLLKEKDKRNLLPGYTLVLHNDVVGMVSNILFPETFLE